MIMSMDDRDGKIWQDGKLIEWRDAKVHVLTHSLHYGMAVFEGVRAYKTAQGTAIFRLEEHTRRLFNSAKIFQLNIPYDFDTVMEAQRQVVRENKLESCYIRPLVWIGSEKLGVSAKGNTIHVAVAAWEWGAYLGEQGYPRQDCILRAPPPERHAGARQGIRQLHQFDSGQPGSPGRRL
jgi:branched-chain amino acid aminotransferase